MQITQRFGKRGVEMIRSDGHHLVRVGGPLEQETQERAYRLVDFQMVEGALQTDRRCPVARGIFRCAVFSTLLQEVISH